MTTYTAPPAFLAGVKKIGRPVAPVEQRLRDRMRLEWSTEVEMDTLCWVYTGHLAGGGYGRMSVNGAVQSTHRTAYELRKGPVPEGLDIDHLCRNRPCFNPAHLEAVSRGENVRRGKSALPSERCRRGHEWTEENTYVPPVGSAERRRRCRVCRNISARRHTAEMTRKYARVA